MKNDQRLIEFYRKLEGRNGFSSEILFHEARLEFRRAWLRDLLGALSGSDAPRLRLGMENAWLWLYYRVEDEEGKAQTWSAGQEGGARMVDTSAAPGNPIAARILAAKNGCDRQAAIAVREGTSALFARYRAGGDKPGVDAECILGSR
jgi:hypothetical protein